MASLVRVMSYEHGKQQSNDSSPEFRKDLKEIKTALGINT